MKNEKTIEITERSSDFHACIKGRPEIWGCGKTPAVAVGDLVLSHKEEFGLTFERKDMWNRDKLNGGKE